MNLARDTQLIIYFLAPAHAAEACPQHCYAAGGPWEPALRKLHLRVNQRMSLKKGPFQ